MTATSPERELATRSGMAFAGEGEGVGAVSDLDAC